MCILAFLNGTADTRLRIASLKINRKKLCTVSLLGIHSFNFLVKRVGVLWPKHKGRPRGVTI